MPTLYEKTENLGGNKSQRVDIHQKFIGYISLGETEQAVKVEIQNQAEKKKSA